MEMTEAEGSQAFLKEWLEQGAILPVATPLLDLKPGVYIPQFLSLGPYHHWKLENKPSSVDVEGMGTYHYGNLKMSTTQCYKVKFAQTLSQKLPNNGKSLDDIVKMVQGMRPEMERFYDWQIKEGEYCRNFAFMMAVDSLFLLRLLISLLSHEADDPTPDIDLSTLRICLKWDILKLENQIPLFVLKQVFEMVKEALVHPLFFPFHPQSFTRLLRGSSMELSPFIFSDMRYTVRQHKMSKVINDAAESERHLLGCMHAIVSPFIKMQGGTEGLKSTLFQRICSFLDQYVVAQMCGIFFCFTRSTKPPINAYSAGQLARAGIKFKSFSTLSNNIRFDQFSHTLYLPQMTVISSMQTEVFFRNLVALEFNDAARPNFVTRYVGLMDCLIGTPDDVRLLRDSHVLLRSSLTLTDEYIAQMWHGMCQLFFDGHLQPPQELKPAIEDVFKKTYYKIRMKVVLFESWNYYYEMLLSRPWKFIALLFGWKFIALLFGIFFLAMNFIQAYCNLFRCKSNN